MPSAFEFNFDGLVGPTHNYSGLSFGNIASEKHRSKPSNPRQAALQGLEKMRLVAGFGVRQAVLPPHERPHLPTLRRLGYAGSDAAILAAVSRESPWLLACVSASSAMWTANAATVSPAADASDGRTHFTPANLANKLHRAIEPETAAHVLKAIFPEGRFFAHHPPLPTHSELGDEGAANHARFAASYGAPGIEFFAYGRGAWIPQRRLPRRYPARQAFEASTAVARAHLLDPDRIVFARQNPAAIDAGVFHNDVAAVGNLDFFFHHEKAFADSRRVIAELRRKFRRLAGLDLTVIEVKDREVSLRDAVRSYLFNTQVLTRRDSGMVLVAPLECREIPAVSRYLDRLLGRGGHPLREVVHADLRQSMRNGGGPACLRLRVVLTEAEITAANPRVFFDEALYAALKAWIAKHYRDRLALKDLADRKLLDESRRALDELTGILGLGNVYEFQK